MRDVLPVFVNCLFEEAPQIGGEIGVHQRLYKVQRLVCCALVVAGVSSGGPLSMPSARLARVRRNPNMPVVLALLRSRVLMPSNLLLVLELRSHKSDHALTCDVKVWHW